MQFVSPATGGLVFAGACREALCGFLFKLGEMALAIVRVTITTNKL